MKIVYLSIQRVTGLMGLPRDADRELFNTAASQTRAFLTMRRDPFFLHLRRREASGRMFAQALVSSGTCSLTPPERFAAILASITVDEGQQSDRPLLIVESAETVESLSQPHLSVAQSCGIGIGLFDQTALVKAARSALEAAVTSIALALPTDITSTVQPVGTVAYAIEPGTGRELYSIEPAASMSMTSMTSVNETQLDDASLIAGRLVSDPDLQTVVHLLARSLQTADDLQAFFTAWAGFEVFLDKVFDRYKERIYVQLKEGIATAAAPFVDRLQHVIQAGGRYNVRDKFVVVSSFLELADAVSDQNHFASIKKIRDGIHTMRLQPSGYPTLEMQNLLRKYLRLHLLSATDRM